jgi:putative transposase
METNKRKSYTNDLTDEEWGHLRILLPKSKGKGRRRSPQQQRELLNAMYYVVRTGCQWRDLPHDFPAWQTVYSYQRELSQAGVWQRINDHLRRGVRVQTDKDPEPSVVIVDSQSVKTTEKRAIVTVLTATKR